MPAVLAVQRVEHRVFDHGEVVVALQCTFELNIAAFNVGNALGAWLGGMTIAAGLGFTSPIWMGAALTVGALAVLGLATVLDRRPVWSEDETVSTVSV